jgi:GTP-binding protein
MSPPKDKKFSDEPSEPAPWEAEDAFNPQPDDEEWDEVGPEFQAGVWHLDDTSEDDLAPVVVEIVKEKRHVPLVAIVGRPNVGKSRLFNRLTATRFAIVEDMPGVTRDRQYGDGQWGDRRFQVVDTGGFEPDSDDILLAQMRVQAQFAIDEADIIFFMMDAHAGLLPADREIARLLRHTKKPVFHIANKVDGPKHEAGLGEFWELGMRELYGISAEHARNYEDLMDAAEYLFARAEDLEVEETHVRVAVLGKPNAGKSTLINRLLGEDRLLTSDIPGTTRDAINTHINRGDQRYLFIDTAGVRRKRSINEQVEKYAVVQSFKAIDRADVVVYMLDATEGVTTQDQRICGMTHDKGRGVILILNKWDLVAKDHKTADEYIRRLREELKFLTYAPVITMSAKTGQRVHRLFPLIDEVAQQFGRRIKTARLNEIIREAITRNQPKSRHSHQLRVLYVSQVASRPPTIMVVVNDTRLVHFSYERYLYNTLRQQLGFEGVPIKLFFRNRRQNDPDLARAERKEKEGRSQD